MDVLDYADCYIAGYMKVWKKWQSDYADGTSATMQYPVTESAARSLAFDKALEQWYEQQTKIVAEMKAEQAFESKYA
jgi:hypothetical protein